MVNLGRRTVIPPFIYMEKTRVLKLETDSADTCETTLLQSKCHCDTDVRDAYLSLAE